MQIDPKTNTSNPRKGHDTCPCLLAGMRADRRGRLVRRHHLSADATGVPYPVAIMDWFTRKVLAWRISNTLDRLLSRGTERGHPPIRCARDHEHRSASPVHVLRLDRPVEAQPAPASRWTARGGASITSSSRSCGGPSGMNASICTPGRPGRRQRLPSDIGSHSTIIGGQTLPWCVASRCGLLQQNRNRPAGTGSSLNIPENCPRIGK